jgi:hypothetical protein
LSGPDPAIVGIDHGFSFPLAYFEQHALTHNWGEFLEDFQRHWPTQQNVYVDFIRDGSLGNGPARWGNNRWRRLTEIQAGSAKSVFHFDVQGSVAKSTHAGLPWLLYLRKNISRPVHFWPFDGWEVPSGVSVVAEVYPALWSRGFQPEDRTSDQHDAYSIAEWLRQADQSHKLTEALSPPLPETERQIAAIEGWILGVPFLGDRMIRLHSRQGERNLPSRDGFSTGFQLPDGTFPGDVMRRPDCHNSLKARHTERVFHVEKDSQETFRQATGFSGDGFLSSSRTLPPRASASLTHAIALMPRRASVNRAASVRIVCATCGVMSCSRVAATKPRVS